MIYELQLIARHDADKQRTVLHGVPSENNASPLLDVALLNNARLDSGPDAGSAGVNRMTHLATIHCSRKVGHEVF
ncbi:MAG: hypothetical protein V2A34_11755 [Lentisphaerota bacterium]